MTGSVLRNLAETADADAAAPAFLRTADAAAAAQALLDMVKFQEIQPGFQIDQFSDFLADRPSFQKGKKRDQRRHSTPKALRELFKVLMRFFEVEPNGTSRLHPQRFVNLEWRETSYAELIKASKKSDALTENTIPFWLKRLENRGIIERFREWDAKSSTKKLWIKLNARRLIDIFHYELPGAMQMKSSEELETHPIVEIQNVPEIKAENTSDLRNEYLGGSEENEAAPTGMHPSTYLNSITPLVDSTLSVIDSAGLQVQKEINPSSASPSREGSSILKKSTTTVSAATVANWKVLSEFFPTITLLTRKQAKFLNRISTHPVIRQRMTLEDVRLYAEYHHADPSNVPGWNYAFCLDIFLKNWATVKAQLHARKNEVLHARAQDFLQGLKEFEADFMQPESHTSWPFDISEASSGSVFRHFVRAFHFKADMAEMVSRYRLELRAWAEKTPSIFIRAAEFLPVMTWAGFKTDDWTRIVGKAFLEHVRAYTYIGNYEKYT